MDKHNDKIAMPQISRTKPSSPSTCPLPDSGGSGVTDRIFEWVIESTLPSHDFSTIDRRMGYIKQKSRPPFSINTTTKNFTRMTCRTGLVFDLIYGIEKVFRWQNPPLTISILCIYSYVCLYPILLAILPLLTLLYGIMVPAYMVRHPADQSLLSRNNVPLKGPPVRPAEVPTMPVPEVSREFYINVVDTQNSMADFVVAYDKMHEALAPIAFFVDENISNMTFLFLLSICISICSLSPLISHIMPTKILFLAMGWYFLISSHPQFHELAIVRIISGYLASYNLTRKDFVEKFKESADHSFVEQEPLDKRLFETFEVQTYDVHTSCWTESLFFPSPYENPEEVGKPSVDSLMAPVDWTFTSNWQRDFEAETWCRQRFTGELEIDDSKWVYEYETSRRVRRWVRWGVPIIKT